MPTIQSLKKKLQVIRSTRKLTKAMKTASTVKYSRLSGLYSGYSRYEQQCRSLYSANRSHFNSLFSPRDTSAPVCYIVITSNKGMCGSFNTELLSFFTRLVREEKSYVVISCGKKGNEFFEKKGVELIGSFSFSDVPAYEEARELFSLIQELMARGEISCVKAVYPEYKNMIKQSPVCRELFTLDESEEEQEAVLYVPDRATVIKNSAEKILSAMLYKNILEAALGAQAATLTTMRSAYDTACEYCAELESAINRKRQSQVTADVLEVSAEFSTEREG